jgi:transposase
MLQQSAALAERDTAIIERDAALRQNDRLAHLLRQLQRMQFGRRSEKLDPDQFALALEDTDRRPSDHAYGVPA